MPCKCYLLTLRKAHICIRSFQTCTQIFGIHKVLVYVRRCKLTRQSRHYAEVKPTVYEYIVVDCIL